MNDNFVVALQAQQSVRDLGATEVRFVKNSLSPRETVHLNFGVNAKIDIVRRAGPRGEQFAVRCAANFAPVAVWIEDNSARDGVLFGGVAKNKSIAEKRKYRGCQFHLRDCLLTRFKHAVFKQINFCWKSRCAVMQVYGGPIFERATTRILRVKPGGFFDKNDETGTRFPQIDSGNDIAAFD